MARFALTPPELPLSLQELRENVRDFLAGECAAGHIRPRCSAWLVADREFSRRCGARGFIGLTLPKEYGGHERSFLDRYVVSEEMLAVGAPAGFHWIADRQSSQQILSHGSEELRKAVLPGIARGEICFAIGMSEPDAGSDLASIRSKAHRVEGGWRLNGRKIWVTNGHIAQYMIGLFRTGPVSDRHRHAGLTQFVIDLAHDGVARRPLCDLTGKAHFSEIVFDDVYVADGCVLGEPGEGWKLVTGELAYERSGPERFLSNFRLLREAMPGLAALHDDTVQIETARLIARVCVLRQMSLAVAGKLESGLSPQVEAALVKIMGNDLEREIPDVLRRIDPRRPIFGVTYHDLLAEALLQSPSITLRGGTPEVLRGIVAKNLGLR